MNPRALARLMFLLGTGVFFVLSGCAHVKRPSGADSDASRSVGEIIGQDLHKDGGASPRTGVVITNGALTVSGIKLKNTRFDIPIVVNSRVEHWVDYFTGRGRKHFERYLERSEYFIPYIVPILRQNGMPEDLVYLSMIESGFNNLARSHAKAVGPWQFIPGTGTRYKLKINWWLDERRDIGKSTVAAIEYLKDLYTMFGSWELAASAYNAGEGKIARAIRRYGSKDFWVLARQSYLKQETRDYVPKMMAAAIVAKNREQFGFRAPGIKPAADEVIAGDGEIVKVIRTEKPLDDPESRADRTEDEQLLDALGLVVEDEEDGGSSDVTSAALGTPMAGKEHLPLAQPVPTPHVNKQGEVGGEALAAFDVQSPADLLMVAQAAGLSYHTVKALNPELLRWCTPPTVSTYRLKLPVSVKERFLQTYNHAAFPRQVEFLTYKVKKGETLAGIARHYGLRVDPISQLNKISSKGPLRAGVRVMLPLPNDRSRSLASLDVRDPPEKKKVRKGSRKQGSKSYKVSYKNRASARPQAHRQSGT